MEKFAILVGDCFLPWNRILKKALEELKGIRVLCFVDSYHKGRTVENTPVIALK
jgi:hypothetical protein